ncbi:MAG: PorV/PorQ family protein [Elusimicrobiales bacterium]|nr:PorV/PorQ family protein [Elusimicrobiales bacterium]
MKKTLILCAALALPAPAYASGAGTTAAPFLKAAMSPRAVGMAGAFSALANDSGAVFVNPAGLAQFEEREAAVDFSTYLQDARMGNVSYAGHAGGNRFGFGATFMTVGGISKRGLNDAAGAVPELGNFSASDMAVTLAYAKADVLPYSLPRLDGGFSVKFIRSAIDDKTAFAAAADAGVIYRANPKINLALAVQNLGTKMKFEEEADPLPLCLRAGGLYRVSPRLNVAAEVAQYLQDEQFYPSVGAEYWFRSSFALRGGYKFGYDTSNLGSEVGLSLGFGVKVSGLGVDYAFLPFGDLGSIHRFGFWLQF